MQWIGELQTHLTGDINSFTLIFFFVNFWWAHFVNLLWPVHSCLSWICKRILIHFSRKSSTSPSLVVRAHYKWFPIDLTHFESDLQGSFWLAFISFFLYVFEKMSHVKLMVYAWLFFSHMLAYLSMTVGRNLWRSVMF